MRNPLDQLLDQPLISRIRRNHGLEHATIHVLSNQAEPVTLVGRADAKGFLLYGEVQTERVAAAAKTALERLRAGEHQLAIHPNCGTNLLTASLLAGSTAFLTLLGVRRDDDWRDRLGRLPTAVFFTTLALIASQPLGAAAQRYLTTEGRPGNLSIVQVKRLTAGRPTIHRVITRG